MVVPFIRESTNIPDTVAHIHCIDVHVFIGKLYFLDCLLMHNTSLIFPVIHYIYLSDRLGGRSEITHVFSFKIH